MLLLNLIAVILSASGHGAVQNKQCLRDGIKNAYFCRPPLPRDPLCPKNPTMLNKFSGLFFRRFLEISAEIWCFYSSSDLKSVIFIYFIYYILDGSFSTRDINV